MNLQVLGHWMGATSDDGASPSYVVSDRNTKILLDCGPGTLPILQKLNLLKQLDAIVISHIHQDHYLDIIPMGSLWFLSTLNITEWKKLRLFLPAGDAKKFITTVSQNMIMGENRFDKVFETIEYGAEGAFDIGTLHITFQQTQHPAICFSPRVTNGENTIVYTADTGYFPELVDHARGADLLLAEASTPEYDPAMEKKGHMCGEETGRLATEANVGRLVLTHFGPKHDDQERIYRGAKKNYNGTVDLASTGAVYWL